MLMLLFYAGSECYALEAGPILEVIPRVSCKKIPHTEEYVAGLINYGGTPVPVIDVTQIVERRPSDPAMHTRIILIKKDNQLIGLIGEKITTTVDLDPSQFIDSGVKIRDLPFLGGIYSKEGVHIQLILLDKIFQ